MRHPEASSTTIRRFAGPEADEFAILWRSEGGSPDPAREADAAYRALAVLLAECRASFLDLSGETLFLRDVRQDLPRVLDARTRVLSELGQRASAPRPAFIQQAPVDPSRSFELAAWVVVPHHRDAWSMCDLAAPPSCICAGCVRSGARLVRLGDRRLLHTANVYGVGGDPFEQVWNMFREAERLLEQFDMKFRDVVRTWIYLRDIGRDYDALNKARREFFRERGIERLPASTGVQGIPFPDAHDFSMTLQAVDARGPLDVSPMSAPSLNEAWSYGADFSRGLRITDANKVALHISGTASIDEGGRTAHRGDLEAQADRMLDNIASLLAREGANFEDLVSGVVYVRNASDAPVLRSICHERGFDRFPCAFVVAPLCRPELLCEAETVALLPLPTGVE